MTGAHTIESTLGMGACHCESAVVFDSTGCSVPCTHSLTHSLSFISHFFSLSHSLLFSLTTLIPFSFCFSISCSFFSPRLER